MDPDAKKMWGQAGRFAAVGIEMGLCVLFGYWIGSYLDRWLGTEPYLMYFWVLAGSGAAFKAVYDAARKVMRQEDADRPRD